MRLKGGRLFFKKYGFNLLNLNLKDKEKFIINPFKDAEEFFKEWYINKIILADYYFGEPEDYLSYKEDIVDMYESFLYDFNNYSDPFPIFRCIRVDNPLKYIEDISLNKIKKMNLGVSWSREKSASEDFCLEFRDPLGKNTIIFCGFVHKEDVDWKRTLLICMPIDIADESSAGSSEKEIRVKENVSVYVDQIEYAEEMYPIKRSFNSGIDDDLEDFRDRSKGKEEQLKKQQLELENQYKKIDAEYTKISEENLDE